MIRTVSPVAIGILITLSMTGCLRQRARNQMLADQMATQNAEVEDRFYELKDRYQDLERRYEHALERLGELPGDEAGVEGGVIDSGELDGGDPDGDSAPATEELPGPQSRRGSNADRIGAGSLEPPPRNSLRHGERSGAGTAGGELALTGEDEFGSDEFEQDWTEPMEVQPAEPIRDWLVTHVVINRYQTQGADFDGAVGDDGIALVFEPRNADDQYLPLAAGVTLSLLDPRESGEDQIIGRWQFSEDEIVSRVFGPGERNQGIAMKLPWQQHAPRHSRLRLFIRYTREDGEQIETSSDVTIRLPSDSLSQWSPRETPLRQVIHEEPVAERLTDRPPSRPQISQVSEGTESSSAPRVARPRWSPYRR